MTTQNQQTQPTETTKPAPLDLDAIERKYNALRTAPWLPGQEALPLVAEVRRLRAELTKLQDEKDDSNAALFTAYADEANRADKAEAEVTRLLQLLTTSLASITIGEICGAGQGMNSE